MPLNGINIYCLSCTKDCKQHKQVHIAKCPFYESKYPEGEGKVAPKREKLSEGFSGGLNGFGK